MSILKDSFIQYIINFLKPKIEAKQDKLVSGKNIKTINGASILGSGNIDIEGGDSTGDVDEGRLAWSSEDSLATLMDIAHLNGNGNKIAGIPPSQVTVEYSSDGGTTWRDSGMNDASKIKLTNTKVDGYTCIRPNNSTELNTQYQTRITIDLIQTNDAGTNVWATAFVFQKILLECTGIKQKDDHTLTIERQKYNSTTWETFKTAKFWGSPDWYSIAMDGRTAGYPSSSYYRRFRLTWQLGDKYTNPAGITHICFLSDKNVGVSSSVKKSQYTQTGVPYLIDYQDTFVFPANLKATKFITNGGTSTQVVKGDGSLEEESALAVASAIDAEHAEEADYASVADKADKLTTARTISLSGGAVGTATTFDGSKNVSIPVTALADLSLTRVYNNNRANSLSLMDLSSPIFSSNRLAFNNPNSILIYKSNDGGATWTDYGATDEQKTKFVSGIDQPIYIGGKTTGQVAVQDRLRVILTSNRYAYTSIEVFLFYITTAGAQSCQCRLSYVKASQFDATLDYNSQTYTEITTKQVLGWSGWNRLLQTYSNGFGYDSADNVKAFMFEFWFEINAGYEDRTGFYISQLSGIGKNRYNNYTGCEMMNNGHLYSYDWQKNATFPAAITATKHITKGGTNQQVVLGNGSLIPLSEISPITDADAEILLDNHIHNININANGNNVNISVIESSKNGNTWETEDNDITIPLATTTNAGVMSKEDKTNIEDLTNDGYVYPTNYLANWNGNSSIEVDDGLQIQLDNITSYNSNTEGLIFTVNIQTPSQHDGEDYIYLSLYDSDENELAYMEHLITDDDCHNGSLQLELKCPLAAITSGYIDLYNNTNEPINIANPILKRYEVKNVRDISDKLLEKIGDINTILESIINS